MKTSIRFVVKIVVLVALLVAVTASQAIAANRYRGVGAWGYVQVDLSYTLQTTPLGTNLPVYTGTYMNLNTGLGLTMRHSGFTLNAAPMFMLEWRTACPGVVIAVMGRDSTNQVHLILLLGLDCGGNSLAGIDIPVNLIGQVDATPPTSGDAGKIEVPKLMPLD